MNSAELKQLCLQQLQLLSDSAILDIINGTKFNFISFLIVESYFGFGFSLFFTPVWPTPFFYYLKNVAG
jgi:hypothetical protein